MKRSFVFVAVALTAALSQAAAIGWNLTAFGVDENNQRVVNAYEGCLVEIFIRHSDADGNVFTGTGASVGFTDPGQLTAILDAAGAKGSDVGQYVFQEGRLSNKGVYTITASSPGHKDITWGGTSTDEQLDAWAILFDTGDASTAKEYAIFGPKNQVIANNNTAKNMALAKVADVGNPVQWKTIGGNTQIPEPATAALLALGLAAFGLRRKARA